MNTRLLNITPAAAANAKANTPAKTKSKDSDAHIADLSTQYLHEWACGRQPNADIYLSQIKSEAGRGSFKQSVGMGQLLRQVLA